MSLCLHTLHQPVVWADTDKVLVPSTSFKLTQFSGVVRSAMLGQSQHLSGIGTGKLRDMVTGNDMRHASCLADKVSVVYAFIRDIFLDKQMAVGQCSDCAVGDAEKIIRGGSASVEHLTDAAGCLGRAPLRNLVVDKVPVGTASLSAMAFLIASVRYGSARRRKRFFASVSSAGVVEI
ncbi:hypothetical protein [Faecalibacterium hattorii]|uniref:hypothetical protein n=1 Tax=Faecalibacterium hattorii TaxID=2935520 RepID=UPI003AAC2A15